MDKSFTPSLRLRLKRKFFHSSRASLISTVVVITSLFTMAQGLTFSLEDYSDGTFSVQRSIYGVFVAIGVGIVVSLLSWFTVIEPLRKQTERAERRRDDK